MGDFGFDLEAGGPFASTVLIRVDPHGGVHVAADDVRFPNGSVITPDGGKLIVAETFGGRYTAWDIEHDGSLTHRRVWARWTATQWRACSAVPIGKRCTFWSVPARNPMSWPAEGCRPYKRREWPRPEPGCLDARGGCVRHVNAR